MTLANIIKPTKDKIYGLAILIVGFIVLQLIPSFIIGFIAQSSTPSSYGNFITGWGATALGIVFLVLYIVWAYVVIGFVSTRKNKK